MNEGIGRNFLVRVVAYLRRDCRHGYPRMFLSEIDEAVRKAYPHRDWEWRQQVYADARKLNLARESRKKA